MYNIKLRFFFVSNNLLKQQHLHTNKTNHAILCIHYDCVPKGNNAGVDKGRQHLPVVMHHIPPQTMINGINSITEQTHAI